MLIKPTAADLAVFGKLNLKDPWIWLATGLGTGFMRPAPGTWGSLAAVPFGLIVSMALGPHGLLAGIAVITYLGWKAAARFEKQTGSPDHSMIVIDEVAGQWVALLGAGLNPAMIVLAFILFRFFDITKIWPANWCDRKLLGAAGVMADDIVAGVYACLCVMVLRYAGFN